MFKDFLDDETGNGSGETEKKERTRGDGLSPYYTREPLGRRCCHGHGGRLDDDDER